MKDCLRFILLIAHWLLGYSIAFSQSEIPVKSQASLPTNSGDRLETPALDVDWTSFLAQQDPIWLRLPVKWEESPFLGNGWMGTMIYQNGKDRPRQLRIDVHHAGVTDHRDGDGMYDTARLPIGYFLIETIGEMESCDLRLDLFNAELKGSIKTSNGMLAVRTIVPSNQDLICFEVAPDEGEKGLKISFHPAQAISPRAKFKNLTEDQYQRNPPHELLQRKSVQVCRQPLLSGGEHATAWQVTGDSNRRLIASVAHSFPESTAVDRAADAVQLSQLGFDKMVRKHREWWHAFYPKSFVSIPDPFWQSFYWIQVYKMGASTRSDGCLIDNHGPWLQSTPWPYATWNLNVQLSYWPYYASGHLKEAESLPRHLSICREQLRQNVIPAEYRHDSYVIGRAATETLNSELRASSHDHWEIGNLTWALHDVWLHYRHTMDDDLLSETLFPLLKGSVNYYLHWLENDNDGKLHLPTTYSPEYGDAADCNYDLALLRWGCETLLWINDRLKRNDAQASEWKRVLENRVDYPQDEGRGFYIGRDVPYTNSHRHYSHLLMVYPLYTVNVDQPGGRELIERCIANWQSKPNALLGYSFTGSSSMYSSLGDGDRALKQLNGLRRFLQPCTMYREGGPVIETPLSAAKSIQDMLVQSWGDMIRVFPSVPSQWKDVCIDRLRTEGAFEISAKRTSGITQWVRVKSLAGEPFKIALGIDGAIETRSSGQVSHLEADRYEIQLGKGEQAFFHRADFDGDAVGGSVLTNSTPQFGLPR